MINVQPYEIYSIFESMYIVYQLWQTDEYKKICPLREHILIARSSLRSQVWARDLIVAPRAPFFLDLVLSYRSYALRIHLSLFLIIRYWISNQFYDITDDVNYTFSQSHKTCFRVWVKQEIQFTQGSIGLYEYILIMILALRARFSL